MIRPSMSRVYITTIVFYCLGASHANSTVIYGPVVNASNHHDYYLLQSDTWHNSEAEAVALGGHLATINDSAEDAWVFSAFGSVGGIDRSLWIGFSDEGVEGTFAWISGEPVTFTNWSLAPIFGGPEPNNDGGNENFAHYFSQDDSAGRGGFWNDNVDVANCFGVVEVVSEPASSILAGIGLVAVVLLTLRPRKSLHKVLTTIVRSRTTYEPSDESDNNSAECFSRPGLA